MRWSWIPDYGEILGEIQSLRREQHHHSFEVRSRLITLEKEIERMAASLTALTTEVTALEATAQAVLAKLGEPGVAQADVDALTTRIKTVVDSLNAAVTPPPPPGS